MEREVTFEDGIKQHYKKATQALNAKDLKTAKAEATAGMELGRRTYGHEILRYLELRLKNTADAEDILQEIQSNLWDGGFMSFRWECSYRTYLYRLAFYAICRQSRVRPRGKLWRHLLSESKRLAKENPKNADTAMAAQEAVRLHKLLVTLQGPYDAAFFTQEDLQKGLETYVQTCEKHALLHQFAGWLRENQKGLFNVLFEVPQKTKEDSIEPEEITRIWTEVTTLTTRQDKLQRLQEALLLLEPEERELVLFVVTENPEPSSQTKKNRPNEPDWKAIAKAWYGFQRGVDLNRAKDQLRKKFERLREQLHGELTAAGLNLGQSTL